VTTLNRRRMLTVLGTAPVAVVAARPVAGRTLLDDQSPTAAPAYRPRFFTDQEFATVALLADLIIPRDARSGSATEAGAHEFVDFIVAEQRERQTPMRGGLVWLDAECRRRFDRAFYDCSDEQRRQVLDDIAYPARARPDMSHGVRFFTSLRDLVAAGFFSSRVGVADLGYVGNRPSTWDGPPREVLEALGL
jgi:gluconate 2-dehydrogenase gamma chain